MWGKQYVDKWAMVDVDELLQLWGKALYGLSEIEFRRGTVKLKDFDRPPSLPEFMKACRPEVNPVKAYYEAIEGLRRRERGEVGVWSHPAIFWASVRVSAHDMMTDSYSFIRQRWEAALSSELEKGQWEEIPKPSLALPAPGNDPKSRQEAARVMKELRSKVNVPSAPRDPLAWAKKILERHENGDPNLPLISVQFARKALGNNDA